MLDLINKTTGDGSTYSTEWRQRVRDYHAHSKSVKELQIGEYIIWKSSNQNYINNVYDIIISVSSDKNYNNKIRANSIDMLIRSNNKYYIDLSKTLLSELRQKERTEVTYRNINEVRNAITERRTQLLPREDIYNDYYAGFGGNGVVILYLLINTVPPP